MGLNIHGTLYLQGDTWRCHRQLVTQIVTSSSESNLMCSHTGGRFKYCCVKMTRPDSSRGRTVAEGGSGNFVHNN
jgi:hypothetical protein